MYIIISYYFHIYYHILAFISITNLFILSYTGLGPLRKTNSDSHMVMLLHHQISTDSYQIPSTQGAQTSAKTGS